MVYQQLSLAGQQLEEPILQDVTTCMLKVWHLLLWTMNQSDISYCSKKLPNHCNETHKLIWTIANFIAKPSVLYKGTWMFYDGQLLCVVNIKCW